MSMAIAHRGPDDSGLWLDETRGIGLGFRLVAILDLSSAGHQPMIPGRKHARLATGTRILARKPGKAARDGVGRTSKMERGYSLKATVPKLADLLKI